MKKNSGLIIFILYLFCSATFIYTSDKLLSKIQRNLSDKIINSNSNVWTNNGALSFLELESKEFLEENVNTQLLNKLETELTAKFLSQMKNGKKRRYTLDGRSCASAFVQDGKTYNDCTNTRSPDGQIKNQEWCYVDPGQEGKIWDYCKPVLNYDKVREANQKFLRDVTVECRKVHDEIESKLSPAQDSLNYLESIRESQADLDNKLNIIIGDFETIKNKLDNLYGIKSMWEREEKKILELNDQIQKKKEKMLVQKSKNKEYYDNSDLTVRNHSKEANQKLSAILQRRVKINEKSCEGMLLYEEEKDGDGIKGRYFDNEAWLGNFVERKDNTIDFNWRGSAPKSGINPNNFSIKWSGYIHAPYTGKYTFAIECDNGASLSINNELIISHNMYTAAEESTSRTDRWLKNEILKKSNPSKNNLKSVSKKVHLTAGNKFKIVVTYFHSIHDIHTEEELTFIKLTWATDEWEEQIIPKKFLFTKNEYPNLKLTGFPKESAVVRNLNENDLAFKNSKTYIIQDIPTEYIGLPTLKFNSRINTKEIVFYTNVPVIVYSAFLAHYPNPLPDIFENTQQSMSLIQIEAGVNKKQKKLLARRSGMLKIFKKSYLQGYVKIPLKSNGFNAKGIPLIMWFANDPDAGGPVTCGGNEINVSNSNGNYYDSCRASSEYRGSSCTSAFNERMKDTLEEMWSSRSEGIGAWIEVKFKQMFLITKIEYKDKKNPLERNSQIELTFDDSSKQIFDIKNTDELKEFTIEPVKTSTVRIEIKRVYGTVNNGGAFKIIGVKCTNIEEEETNPNKNKLAQVTGVKQANSIPALFRNEEKEMIKCKCMDSISNSKKFQSIVKTVGAKILIYCAETCSMTDYNIYGDLTYSRDSAICRSAFHSQTLPAEGGKVWLIFQNGRSSYKSQIRNGIRSEGKSKSDLSFSFEGYFKQGEIIMEVGSKIDLVNPYTSGWIGAVIMKIQQKDYKNKLIEVAIEGVNQPHLTYNYPDKSKIQPCGEFVKNRDCRSSRRNLNKKVPIRIRFLPEDYYEDGNHLPENGRIYGFNNRPFGWSKDMRGKIRQFNEASKQELHSYIEFPPSPKSKICKAPNSTCDKVTWSVRVGIGRFFVRLFAGDPENQTKLDLKINDVFLAKNKVIDQNKLKIYEQVLESKDEFLVLSNNCEENCDLANAKINAIEISQYVEKPKTPKATSSEIQLNCGHAFIGGRCDTGPDILHCLIDDPSKEVAGNCGGSNVLMLIPSTYQCKDQIGKYKCMKKIYESNDECRKNCVNNCIRNQCIG